MFGSAGQGKDQKKWKEIVFFGADLLGEIKEGDVCQEKERPEILERGLFDSKSEYTHEQNRKEQQGEGVLAEKVIGESEGVLQEQIILEVCSEMFEGFDLIEEK